jgi:hypothetical protein
MTEAEILSGLAQLWPGPVARNVFWVWPTLEVLHFVGLTMLVGAMLVVDLRLIGYFKSIPVATALKLLPYAIVGFGLCAFSGWAFFTADPTTYWTNYGFRLKLVALTLAGINAVLFTVLEHRHALQIDSGGAATGMTRLTAGLSLGLWLIVLILGRMLPNTGFGTN